MSTFSANSILVAECSPSASFDCNLHPNEDHPGGGDITIAPDVPFYSRDEGERDDIIFDETSQDEQQGEGFSGKMLEPTPKKRAIGRLGFDPLLIFAKCAMMHIFGGRCNLSLVTYCLQMAHVIPVSSTTRFLSFLERVFGDRPKSLNIHSSRNIWIVNVSLHSAIDRGLIKLVPEMQVLVAIMSFTTLIHQIRIRRLERQFRVEIIEDSRTGGYKTVAMGGTDPASPPSREPVSGRPKPQGENSPLEEEDEEEDLDNATATRNRTTADLDDLIDNDAPEIQRNQVFPAGNYRYHLVGILCSEEFVINRHHMENRPKIEPPVPSSTEDFQFRPIPLPLSSTVDKDDMGGTDTYGRAKPRFLKGMKVKKESSEIIYPLESNNNVELALPQDPVLVTANVGEFLYVLGQKVYSAGKVFDLGDLIKDDTHRSLLQVALDIYTQWKLSDRRIEEIRRSLEANQRPPQARSRSQRTTSEHRHQTRAKSQTSGSGTQVGTELEPQSGPGPSTAVSQRESKRTGGRSGGQRSTGTRSSRQGSQAGETVEENIPESSESAPSSPSRPPLSKSQRSSGKGNGSQGSRTKK